MWRYMGAEPSSLLMMPTDWWIQCTDDWLSADVMCHAACLSTFSNRHRPTARHIRLRRSLAYQICLAKKLWNHRAHTLRKYWDSHLFALYPAMQIDYHLQLIAIVTATILHLSLWVNEALDFSMTGTRISLVSVYDYYYHYYILQLCIQTMV